jgi:hypothetical protein
MVAVVRAIEDRTAARQADPGRGRT